MTSTVRSFPERNLNQKCLYWGLPIPDGRGSYSYADPVELDCRWVETVKVVKASNGLEKVSSVQVQVAQDVVVEGMMLLGRLVDLESGQFNDPVAAGAWTIIQFSKIPTIKGDRFYRKAYL